MRIILAILMAVLASASPPAFASNFGPGFLLTMIGLYAGAFIAIVWPLILPFFYLRRSSGKLKLYFALTLAAYGTIGLLSVPFQLLIFLDSFGLLGGSINPVKMQFLGGFNLVLPLAFVFSLFMLPKVKRLLATCPVAP